jgi:hypothetical protein
LSVSRRARVFLVTEPARAADRPEFPSADAPIALSGNVAGWYKLSFVSGAI